MTDPTTTTPTTLQLSAAFLEDHLNRLYTSDGQRHLHVDRDDAEIMVTKWKGTTATIEATHSALLELADDADYQAEFDEGSYAATAKRVCQKVTALLEAGA